MPDCEAEFIVTRGADEGELRCGTTPSSSCRGCAMAVALGKRYKDESTGIEVLCIKPVNATSTLTDAGWKSFSRRCCRRPTSSQ